MACLNIVRSFKLISFYVCVALSDLKLVDCTGIFSHLFVLEISSPLGYDPVYLGE